MNLSKLYEGTEITIIFKDERSSSNEKINATYIHWDYISPGTSIGIKLKEFDYLFPLSLVESIFVGTEEVLLDLTGRFELEPGKVYGFSNGVILPLRKTKITNLGRAPWDDSTGPRTIEHVVTDYYYLDSDERKVTPISSLNQIYYPECGWHYPTELKMELGTEEGWFSFNEDCTGALLIDGDIRIEVGNAVDCHWSPIL